MQNRIILAFMVAAAGSTASADNFSWVNGAVGPWGNPAYWNGPGGQVPDSFADVATISGGTSKAYLDDHVSVGTLTLSAGALLDNQYLSNHTLDVSTTATITGLNSEFRLRPTGTEDLVAGDLVLSNWGELNLLGAHARIADDVWIGDDGYLKGAGLLTVGGDLVLATGADIIAAADAPGTLTIEPDDASARLDWGASDWKIAVWPGQTLEMLVKPKNAMGGFIDIASTGDLVVEHPWLTTPGSLIELGGDATITGGPIDIHGTLQIAGNGVLSGIVAPLIALRGDVVLGDSDLVLSGWTMLDTASITAANATEGNMRFGPSTSALTVTGDGLTSIVTPGTFDLDGANGNLVTTIQDGATLQLSVGAYDVNQNEDFNGELVVEGALFLDGPFFPNAGVITMDGGGVLGQLISNDGVITGRGAIANTIYNNAEIEAIGGTLTLSSKTVLDGAFEVGHVKAVDGDIVLAGGTDDQHFNGSMWIGNGAGIPEVLDMDGDLIISQDFGVPGSLAMNAGRILARTITLESQFTNEGDSILQTPGGQPNHVLFQAGSTNAIDGSLELWSDASIKAGAAFSGAGSIRPVSGKTLDLRAGADTGTVGVDNAGTVAIEGDQVGSVEVGSYTQQANATLGVTISGVGHDLMTSDTTVTLAGTLDVSTLNGFIPQFGSSYTIIQAEQIDGEFDEVTWSQEISAVLVDVSSTEVVITLTCPADINGDGVLNVLDFVAFQEKWSAEDPGADCDHNGLFNILDFVCYQTLFQQPCN